MGTAITCICGYRGPSVAESGREVCPICRTPAALREERLRIACPRGHVLEVNATLLGQRVVCPQCNEFFVLTAEAGVERQRELARQRQDEDARRARIWLVRALVAAAVVVILFAALIVLSAVQK